jgi:two-component system chemotaxis sensor kinase CheA
MDNVAQALLTIDASGFLASERSAKADLWFGKYDVPLRFADYIASTDPAFAAFFQLSFEALVEGILPQEVLLAQMPRTLTGQARRFRCAYHVVADGGDQLVGLIIVIDDMTEEIRHSEEQAEQRELAAILRGIMRDKAGLITAIEEGTDLVQQLQAETASPAIMQRVLHTMKGLTAMAGIERVATLCHQVEDQLEIGETVTEGIGAIAELWRITCETVRTLVESQGDRAGDVSRDDIERLIGQIRGGLPVEAVLVELGQWRFEPIERGLRRLAQHATFLAARLGKGEIQIDVSAPGLRLDPRIWNPLCAALMHVVRNAVDHGIETPSERAAAGKTPQGRLVMRAGLEERAVVIEIQDDGRGIDWIRVRELAVQKKMPADSRADLIHSLLSQGFSTRAEVTDVSGRGVGLSVLKEEMQRAGGTIDVVSEPRVGTTWRIALPHPGSSAPPALHANTRAAVATAS